MDAENSSQVFAPSKEFVRTHGLQLPLNLYQILSWIVFFAEMLTTLLIFIPPLSLALKVLKFPL